MTGMGTPIAETQRLHMREFAASDLVAMTHIFGDPEVIRLGDGPQSVGSGIIQPSADSSFLPEENKMKQWETLEAVERDPNKVSGVWVFRGTRVPVAALFENLRDGATIEEFLEWFPGVERAQVEAILDHEIEMLAVAV